MNVTCVDTNKEKIESLQKGNIPIYENGLEEMVLRNMKAKRLKFTTSLESCLDEVEVIFTPISAKHVPDTRPTYPVPTIAIFILNLLFV